MQCGHTPAVSSFLILQALGCCSKAPAGGVNRPMNIINVPLICMHVLLVTSLSLVNDVKLPQSKHRVMNLAVFVYLPNLIGEFFCIEFQRC